MTREEILAKSRNENKGRDFMELDIVKKSRGIASAFALILGAGLNLLATFRYGRSFTIFWVLFFAAFAADGLTRGITMVRGGRKQGWMWLGYGALMGAMTVLAVVKYLRELGVIA